MKIMICVPCMDQVPAQFAQSLATLNKVEECSIAFQMGSLIYNARNYLATMAIKNEIDYVLWLDSDMTFPPDLLQRLYEDRDKGDIITGIYYRRVAPYRPVLFDHLVITDDGGCEWTNLDEYPEGLFEIEGCGFGSRGRPLLLLAGETVRLQYRGRFQHTVRPCRTLHRRQAVLRGLSERKEMRVKITQPCRVNILSGDVEVNEQEYQRLLVLNLVAKEEKRIPEEVEIRETPEKPKKKK